MTSASAIAHPNIAFIKYWGNRDNSLRLPSNGSISMNLDGLETRTSVIFDPSLFTDELAINNEPASGPALERVVQVLDLVRQMANIQTCARVESQSNFPVGSGIASSASAFAALALAATKAAGLELPEADLSRLARRGSGSACRSVPAGFVEWNAGRGDANSYAMSIAPPNHWDLVDCIAVVSPEPKTTGSSQGNALAGTSPFQSARIEDAPRRLQICREAILKRDFEALATIVELDSNLLHAVMMTSQPALFYWLPPTLSIMQTVREERARGLPVCYSIDAGPNVHVITLKNESRRVQDFLSALPGVQNVRIAAAGGPARLV